MSTHKVQVDWKGEGEAFVGHNEVGPQVYMDSNKEAGTSPMVLLLHAEAGCTGIDVVSLLAKMKQPLTGLRIEVTGEKTEGDFPRIWEKIHLRYIISGDVEHEKAHKAVSLSMEKYCSVSAMLSRAAEVTYEVELLG